MRVTAFINNAPYLTTNILDRRRLSPSYVYSASPPFYKIILKTKIYWGVAEPRRHQRWDNLLIGSALLCETRLAPAMSISRQLQLPRCSQTNISFDVCDCCQKHDRCIVLKSALFGSVTHSELGDVCVCTLKIYHGTSKKFYFWVSPC